MKNYRTIAFLLGALVLGATAPIAHAQRAPADVQKEYDQFITKFREALKANNGDAVTQMTKFPFYWNEMRDAAYFRKNLYGKVFTSKIRNCIARGKGAYARDPEGTENFTIFCGDDLFLFAKTPDGFRFLEIGVND